MPGMPRSNIQRSARTSRCSFFSCKKCCRTHSVLFSHNKQPSNLAEGRTVGGDKKLISSLPFSISRPHLPEAPPGATLQRLLPTRPSSPLLLLFRSSTGSGRPGTKGSARCTEPSTPVQVVPALPSGGYSTKSTATCPSPIPSAPDCLRAAKKRGRNEDELAMCEKKFPNVS